MKDHIYDLTKIVIGSDLPAMAYAFKHECPIIYRTLNPPHKFDSLNNGFSKSDVYKNCCLLLSLSGLIPLGDKVTSIRIDENMLRISTTGTKLVKIKYDKLYIFDETQIENMPIPAKRPEKKFQIIDWFNVRSGMCHEHDQIESASDFVKCIRFYPSDRISGNHDKKDLAAFSYMTEEQLDLFEYSPTYVRFKVEKMMKDAGIRGSRNGKNSLYPKNSNQPYKYRALVVEPAYREKVCLTRPCHENTKNHKFMHLSIENILNSKTKKTNLYLQKLKEIWNLEAEISGPFTLQE